MPAGPFCQIAFGAALAQNRQALVGTFWLAEAFFFKDIHAEIRVCVGIEKKGNLGTDLGRQLFFAGIEKITKNGSDTLSVLLQNSHECVSVCEATTSGQSHQLFWAGRQVVSLLLVDDLDAMLCGTQEAVGGTQVVSFFCGNERFVAEELQGLQRVAFPQMRIFPSVDQLQSLNKKFDFADTAIPQLEVQLTFFLACQAAINFLFHHFDVIDHGVIKMTAVDERFQSL